MKLECLKNQREPRKYLFPTNSACLTSSFLTTRKYYHSVPTINRVCHDHSKPRNTAAPEPPDPSPHYTWGSVEGFESTDFLNHPKDSYVIGLGAFWASEPLNLPQPGLRTPALNDFKFRMGIPGSALAIGEYLIVIFLISPQHSWFILRCPNLLLLQCSIWSGQEHWNHPWLLHIPHILCLFVSKYWMLSFPNASGW